MGGNSFGRRTEENGDNNKTTKCKWCKRKTTRFSFGERYHASNCICRPSISTNDRVLVNIDNDLIKLPCCSCVVFLWSVVLFFPFVLTSWMVFCISNSFFVGGDITTRNGNKTCYVTSNDRLKHVKKKEQ